jgi:TPR repeat protein
MSSTTPLYDSKCDPRDYFDPVTLDLMSDPVEVSCPGKHIFERASVKENVRNCFLCRQAITTSRISRPERNKKAFLVYMRTLHPERIEEFKKEIEVAELEDLLLRAKKDDADAQVELGFVYKNEKSTLYNPHEARKWWEKAAKQEKSPMLFCLAMMQKDGKGGPVDLLEAECNLKKDAENAKSSSQKYSAAFYAELLCENNRNVEEEVLNPNQEPLSTIIHYYKLSLSLGHTDAAHSLGMLYYDGKIVAQDLSLAMKYLKQAANAKNASSQFMLGLLYYYGLGTKKDVALAKTWWEKSAANGSITSLEELGKLHLKGAPGIPHDLKKGLAYLRKAVFKGSTSAAPPLLQALSTNRQMTSDTEFKFVCKLTAKQGDAEAQEILGYHFYDKDSEHYDPTEARKYWEKAAAQGRMGEYLLKLGNMQFYGDGGSEDDTAAISTNKLLADSPSERTLTGAAAYNYIFFQAFELKAQCDKKRFLLSPTALHYRKLCSDVSDVNGLHLLGNLYKEYDTNAALGFYLKAYELGSVKAAKKIGKLYQCGTGSFCEDTNEAIKWYERGEERGCTKSSTRLGVLYYNKGVNAIFDSYHHPCKYDQGFAYIRKAFKRGHKEAAICLFERLYEENYSKPSDECKQVCQVLADENYMPATEALLHLWLKKVITISDDTKLEKFISHAVDLDDKNSFFLYLNLTKTKTDPNACWGLWELAQTDEFTTEQKNAAMKIWKKGMQEEDPSCCFFYAMECTNLGKQTKEKLLRYAAANGIAEAATAKLQNFGIKTSDLSTDEQYYTLALKLRTKGHYEKAKQCFEIAASLGHSGANYITGKLLLKGKYKGLTTGIKLFEARKRFATAIVKQGQKPHLAKTYYKLGRMHLKGKCGAKDPSFALQHFQKASDWGHIKARIQTWRLSKYKNDSELLEADFLNTLLRKHSKTSQYSQKLLTFPNQQSVISVGESSDDSTSTDDGW